MAEYSDHRHVIDSVFYDSIQLPSVQPYLFEPEPSHSSEPHQAGVQWFFGSGESSSEADEEEEEAHEGAAAHEDDLTGDQGRVGNTKWYLDLINIFLALYYDYK